MVVVRLMLIDAAEGRFGDVEGVFQDVAARVARRPGFMGSTFFQDPARRELGSLTKWATLQDAEAGAAANFAAIEAAFRVAGGTVVRHALFQVTRRVDPTT